MAIPIIVTQSAIRRSAIDLIAVRFTPCAVFMRYIIQFGSHLCAVFMRNIIQSGQENIAFVISNVCVCVNFEYLLQRNHVCRGNLKSTTLVDIVQREFEIKQDRTSNHNEIITSYDTVFNVHLRANWFRTLQDSRNNTGFALVLSMLKATKYH